MHLEPVRYQQELRWRKGDNILCWYSEAYIFISTEASQPKTMNTITVIFFRQEYADLERNCQQE